MPMPVRTLLYRFLTWVDYAIHRHIRTGSFIFNGQSLPYFVHSYNTTWRCERAVEIPIIWPLVRLYQDKNVLEVGNVLSHYFSVGHDIVDKYEKAEGVIHEDALFFNPNKTYDLIVSISTLEHIGWDETPREPEKVLLCIHHLKSLLSSGGLIVFSVPSGYNPYLDDILRRKAVGSARYYHLKRTAADRWKQSDYGDIEGVTYGVPWGAANGITIVYVDNP
jgi:hypothetical protein